MSLKVYKAKRDFSKSPEPSGDEASQPEKVLRFVIQKHQASHLHFDLRLEWDGVFKSWAVPKGPSLNPGARRLAVAVEEHPLAYGDFEGIIPAGNYGAGVVMIWDRGTYTAFGHQDYESSCQELAKGFAKGHLALTFSGQRLQGGFDLVFLREKKNWLLIKKRDPYATYKDEALASLETSVVTGRTFAEIAAQAPAKKALWVTSSASKTGTGDTAPVAARDAPSFRDAARTTAAGPAQAGCPSEKSQPLKPQVMRALILRQPVQGQGWVYEPLLAGVRALLWKKATRLQLYSHAQLQLERSYPQLVKALHGLSGDFILDGELVAERYWASDLLYWQGYDYRDLPYQQRRQALKELLEKLAQQAQLQGATPRLELVPSYTSLVALQTQHEQVTEVCAKDPASPYVAKVSPFWLKFQLRPREHQPLVVTHPQKLYWPEDKISKAELIAYYDSVAEYILPHLYDRPLSLNRHPQGIRAQGFYQKDFGQRHPRWLKTWPIYARSTQKTIHYALCQNRESLLYLANLGCIEFNPWFSTIHDLDRPNFLVIDLDPDGHSFAEVVAVALQVKALLDELEIPACVKTSGASGLHIGVGLQAQETFAEVAGFAEGLCQLVCARNPELTTIERSPGRRKGKIYLDYLQNHRGQTLAAPYCVRPLGGAPVSAPLFWDELSAKLHPSHFHLKNMRLRLEQVGDLWLSSERVVIEDYKKKLQEVIKS